MFRPILKSARSPMASRMFIRNNHHSYGPEEPLFKKSLFLYFGIGSTFLGLVLYDNVYAEKSSNKSLIGDWLIPTHPTKEEQRALLQERTNIAVKQREDMVLLLSPKNNRPNVEENYNALPVPDPAHRGVAPGSVIDLNNIDERRPRTVYLKQKEV